MIRVLKHAQTHRCNFHFSDYFQFKSSYLVLVTQNLEESPVYQKINHIILEKILHENFESLDDQHLLLRLRDFFIELNWQTFSLLANEDVPEKGISLCFSYVRNDTIYFVQFGRLLAGLLHKNDFKPIGKTWENFHIQTKKQLFLLGSLDENITVKVQKLKLNPQEKFFVLPYAMTQQMDHSKAFNFQIEENLEDAYKVHAFPYFVLGKEKTIVSHNSKFFTTKARLTILILFLTTTFSLTYVFFGNNLFEDKLNLETEKLVEEIRNFPIEQIEAYGIRILAPQSIKLVSAWKTNIRKKITIAPQFDHKRLFLVTGNELRTYHKKTQKKLWSYKLNSPIKYLQLLDNDLLLLIAKNGKMFCLNRKLGALQWQQKAENSHYVESIKPIIISIDKDRRLTTSLLVQNYRQHLLMTESVTGDTLATYQFDEKIDLISEYDHFNKCLYAIRGKTLFCLNLKILR